MKLTKLTVMALGGMVVLAAPAQAKKCKTDAVQVGPVCVDKYEASVWEIPATNAKLIKQVKKGKIESAADLSGATQRGATTDDYGAGCPDSGNGCKDFYAVSIAGVTPAANLTWFQAVAACRNAGKRLLTNQEWQMAAFGTPDPGTDNGVSDCNISVAGAPVETGSRSTCVSDVGAFDTVGNLDEFVADWGDRNTGGCPNWTTQTGLAGNDVSCFAGAGSTFDERIPGALVRGGSYASGTSGGVFSVVSNFPPTTPSVIFGFRCAREL